MLGGYGDLCAAQVDFHGRAPLVRTVPSEIAPESGLVRPARAMARLAMGDFERGWEEYESRWSSPNARRRSSPSRNGTASPSPAGQLLLHAEQGLGDTIQFVRFASLAKQFGGRVVLASQPALLPILADVAAGVDVIVGNDGELPAFDCQLPVDEPATGAENPRRHDPPQGSVS